MELALDDLDFNIDDHGGENGSLVVKTSAKDNIDTDPSDKGDLEINAADMKVEELNMNQLTAAHDTSAVQQPPSSRLSQAVEKLVQACKLMSSCGVHVCIAVASDKTLQVWKSPGWREDIADSMRQLGNRQAGLDQGNMDVEMFVKMNSPSQSVVQSDANKPAENVIICEEYYDDDEDELNDTHVILELDNVIKAEPAGTKKPAKQKTRETKESITNGNSQKPYKCNYCDFTTAWKTSLRAHMLGHTNGKPIQCPLCSLTLATSTDLLKHMRTHTGEKPYKCDICDHRSSRAADVAKHKSLVHDRLRKFECTLCNYTAAYKKYYVEHMRLHTGERLKCKHCDFTTVSSTRLVTHVRRHTGEKPLKCQYCDYRTGYERSYYAHLRIHTGKMFNCEVCKYKTNRKDNLNKHVRACHPDYWHADTTTVQQTVEVETLVCETTQGRNEATDVSPTL